MNDTPSPFAPFTPSPPTQPEQPAAEKKTRKPRTVKTITAVTMQPDGTATTTIEDRPRQRRKKATEDKPSLKFDLQTILAAAAMLNADDQAAFEKVVGILSDAGKPGRERLLAAIGKIFA